MQILTKKDFFNTRNWMLRNARPLDMARWNFHFEGGEANAVLCALSAYQNTDGGFGHALEPDSLNPNSSPIQTWMATEILTEIGQAETNHPIVQGILHYLESGQDFDGQIWLNTIQSNDDYPHAPWWGFGPSQGYNPSAALIGFILLHAKKESSLHAQAKRMAAQAVAHLQNMEPDMHEITCYIRLLECIQKANMRDELDVLQMEETLQALVHQTLENDLGKWESGYVCTPVQYFISPQSPYCARNEEAVKAMIAHLLKTRNDEGVWEIAWSWGAYEKEFAISANWWKAYCVVRNVLYLRNFGSLT